MRLKLPLIAAFALLSPPSLLAQPADLPIPAARTSEYPAGISVRQTRAGPVYADARGRTLYGLDMRTVLRWSPDASQFCKDRCPDWEPLLAPADAKPTIMFPRGFGGPPPPRGAPPAPRRGSAPRADQARLWRETGPPPHAPPCRRPPRRGIPPSLRLARSAR